MAGHSKWANIQHRKGRQDAKRAKIFTKLVREITVSARLGGPDPEANPRLRSAVAEARVVNMPADNIQRAIDKGAGNADGDSYEEFTYEGYGPGGVAILIEGLTDNRNRTAAEIRSLFSRAGGNLAENGSVAWQFERKSLITVAKDSVGEVRLTELLIECGAEDFEDAGEDWIVTAAGTDLHTVADGLSAHGVEPKSSQWVMVPSNEMDVDSEVSGQVAAMLDKLEDQDDVQKVWSNVNPETLVYEDS
ncbi:MAG: YebC/PmpR family DNA-binding transcriptional regulator [Thermoanaerobaculia bacterium]|nr:YebC/PmpR family DNA-binding transcriptional regulator [Thermoanaerobaculia bacterium]